LALLFLICVENLSVAGTMDVVLIRGERLVASRRMGSGKVLLQGLLEPFIQRKEVQGNLAGLAEAEN
jgi:uncharacterized protein (AIM24 family)